MANVLRLLALEGVLSTDGNGVELGEQGADGFLSSKSFDGVEDGVGALDRDEGQAAGQSNLLGIFDKVLKALFKHGDQALRILSHSVLKLESPDLNHSVRAQRPEVAECF